MASMGGKGYRAIVTWAAALLLAVAFAGCTSGAKQQSINNGLAGHAEQTQETVVDGAAGSLQGTVLNENGAPIKRAHVTVIGTPFYNDTDKDGAFSFTGLPLGDHVVRADAQGYDSFEAPTRVDADKLTKLVITLTAPADVGIGFRDHVHDFWGDERELLLLEGTVNQKPSMLQGGSDQPYACANPPTGGGLNSEGTNGCYIVPVYLAENHIVPPGTGEVQVTVTWEKRDLLTAIEFRWSAANMTSAQAKKVPMNPGDTKSIKVLDGMNDHGHARYSLWTFAINQRPGAAGAAIGSDVVNDRFVGPFKVKIVAVKGDTIYPEAPHARFWEAGDRRVLVAGDTHYINGTPANRVRDPRFTICTNTLNQVCWLLPAKTIVPPGTTRLDITLTYLGPMVPGTGGEKTLTVRTAATQPSRATLDALKMDDKAVYESGKTLLKLKLDPNDPDAFYQKTSTWMFLLANRGAERSAEYVPTKSPVAVSGTTAVYDQVTLVVEAVNENWKEDRAAGRI